MAAREKESIAELLLRRDFEEILRWAAKKRGAFRALISMTYREDSLLRWRALEAIGRVAAARAVQDLSAVRDLIRRLLWNMNDESGGLGWYAPEAIGEILHEVPALIDEYGPLLGAYLEEEPFQAGVRLALARASERDPRPFEKFVDALQASLRDPAPLVRARSFMALRALGRHRGVDRATLDALAGEDAALEVYDFEKGLVKQTTLGEMVAEGLRG